MNFDPVGEAAYQVGQGPAQVVRFRLISREFIFPAGLRKDFIGEDKAGGCVLGRIVSRCDNEEVNHSL